MLQEVLWQKNMDAVVGDRANELYLATACQQEGLRSRDYDRLRRELLSTRGLGEGSGEERAKAERKEELVGRASFTMESMYY